LRRAAALVNRPKKQASRPRVLLRGLGRVKTPF
jgi:hypothetical protein